jgi:hypothetical protein
VEERLIRLSPHPDGRDVRFVLGDDWLAALSGKRARNCRS